jgi:F0F1-type ATP synthase alpha subunit
VDVKTVESWEKTYLETMKRSHKKLIAKINEKKILEKEDEEELKKLAESVIS